ncbi:MAG: hypothetical protein P1P87_07740, partial [Trueperaceae bacterium]|nr:hypothetical protein [Trueperaceae bacterium]
MTLDQLLLALPDPIRVIGGDATQLDVWRVLEVDADAPPLAGTIYLAGDAAAVATAVERFGAHVDVAVLAPRGCGAPRPEVGADAWWRSG